MADVSAKLVKDLRDKTGAGMMDCKKALAESGGDMIKASEWLRQKGIAVQRRNHLALLLKVPLVLTSIPEPG